MAGRLSVGALVGFILLCVLIAASPELSTLLEYRREAVVQGELWRLATGSLTHTNLWHLLLNSAGLVLLACAARQDLTPGRAARALAFAMLGAFALEHLAGSNGWARGLSGPLHGLAAYWLVTSQAPVLRWAGLPVLGAKLFLEGAGALPDSSTAIEATVLHSHHLYGALIGLGLALAEKDWGHFAPGAARVPSSHAARATHGKLHTH